MLLSSNARGARGNSKGSRGSATRGRGQTGRGALNNSSGTFDNSMHPLKTPALMDTTNAYRGKSYGPGRGFTKNHWYPEPEPVQRKYSHYSKTLAMASANTPNPFEQERLDNAAKREQRGQNGPTVNSRGGKGTPRGALHSNKQVRFANPPTEQQTNPASTTSGVKNPFASNTAAVAASSNPFAVASNTASNPQSTTSNVFAAPTGPSATNSFASPFARPPAPSAPSTNIFGAPSGSPAFNPFANSNSSTTSTPSSSAFGTPAGPSSASFSGLNNAQKNGILKDSKGASAKRNAFVKPEKPSSQNAVNKKAPQANFGAADKSYKSFGQQNSTSAIATSASSTDASFASSSELASKISDLLRKQNIKQPRCAAKNPGDPSEKAKVKEYLDALKKHRARVRAALINANLIDDPLKPKKLSEAIDFKGTCDTMCPEEEIIRRIIEDDVQRAEKEVAPDGSLRPSPRKMIKKLARSAAGEDAPLPQDVRSPAALRKTVDYLIHSILGEQGNLASQHEFVWDRTRAIRRDFVFQSSMSPAELEDQVYCLEKITRFHVTALHQMSKPGAAPENFEEQQEVEQLSKSMLSLIHAYEDCNLQNIPCENEAEFRAYYVLLNSSAPGILETVQDWGYKFWGESEQIKIAVSLVESLQNIWSHRGPLQPSSATNVAQNAFSRFFTILKDSSISYTMACFAEMHFNEVRKNVFKTILSAYQRQRDQTKDWTLSRLNKYLHFDDEYDIVAFGESYQLRFDEGEGGEYCLSLAPDNRVVDPFPVLKQPYSKSIVERKSGGHSLTELIDSTVYEEQVEESDDSKENMKENEESSSDDSLFVKENSGTKPTPSVFAPVKSPVESPWISEAAEPAPVPPPTPKPAPAQLPAVNWALGNPTTTPHPGTYPSQPKPQAFFTPPAPRAITTTPTATPPFQGTNEPPKFTWPSNDTSFPQAPIPPTEPPNLSQSAFPPPNNTPKPPVAFLPPATSNPGNTSSKPVFQPFAGLQAQPPVVFTPPAPTPVPTLAPTPAPVFAATTQPQSSELFKPTLQYSSAGPSQPPQPEVAPLEKFAEWFALGEEGIIEQFTNYNVERIVRETMNQFTRQKAKAERKEARRIAQEEAELARVEADQFRRYSLGVKYYHMWRANSHRLRLRREGREARRARKAFAESIKASKAALSAQIVDDFRASTTKNKRPISRSSERKRPSPESLLAATGVLDGVHNRDEQLKAIMNGHSELQNGNKRRKSSTSSITSESTTNGLRRVASDNPLRRSLLSDPSFLNGGSRIHLIPDYQATHETRPQISGVQTDYFRLKARGITTLPNGTPLASAAVRDTSYRKHSFDGIARPSKRRITKDQIPRSSPGKASMNQDQDDIIFSPPGDDELAKLKARAKEIMSKDFGTLGASPEAGVRGRLKKRGLEVDDRDEDLFERAKRVREQMDVDSEWLRREVDRFEASRSQSASGF